ncbi:Mitochondrial transcription termination factor family protein [Striga hermonthica]|uniref:Mitochondrial transcription termination factor family protein n=1 Tax=Striga hermonthica TaxID=68872 RepID=A0A9N7NWC3_STRHE|nr:Mitochondrial transcription termination factor family protein [Striga hermonthica]
MGLHFGPTKTIHKCKTHNFIRKSHNCHWHFFFNLSPPIAKNLNPFPSHYFLQTSSPDESFHGSKPPRIPLKHLGYRTDSASNLKLSGNLGKLAKKFRSVKKEAQDALLDYFHCTRSLQIIDAENLSKNTPLFFDKLLKRVDIDNAKVGPSFARFLRYHPVNEFEPFFESIGLRPSECLSLLPQNLMFLNDDELLLENYHVLCDYGIPRNRIGKIYKEVREVFRYDFGVLLSKLQSFQKFGLKQSLIGKIIASSPRLLIGSVDRDFVNLLKNLKNLGIEYEWLEENISVEESSDWKHMLQLMCFLRNFGLSEEQLRHLLTLHPSILLQSSGRFTFCLSGSLLKFGHTPGSIQNLLLDFPHIPVVKFTRNLLRCYEFLVKINMDAQEIGKFFSLHATFLGSCKLKKASTIFRQLNHCQDTLYELVKEDPFVLRKWVHGKKLTPLPVQKRSVTLHKLKTEFLMSLGFEENSTEMEKAFKDFRGRGDELQERFDFLVEIGLRREDVIQMIKLNPQILSQTLDVMKSKVNYFLNELGYSMSDLVSFPRVLSYKMERVKMRLLMHKWLKCNVEDRANLTLATLLANGDEAFMRLYVNPCPGGLEHWKELKKMVCSDRMDNHL